MDQPGGPRGNSITSVIQASHREFEALSLCSDAVVDGEADVLDVSSTALRVAVPAGVSEGTLRVATFTGEGTLGIAPSVGNLEVVARTEYGKNVSGVDVRVTQNGETVATGTTDGSGTASFGDLFTGSYGVEVTGVRRATASAARTA